MKFIFSSLAKGKISWKKQFRSNDLKYIVIESLFCANSKYEICFKTNEDYSIQNPSNINQICHKSAIENSPITVWLIVSTLLPF